MNEEIRGWRSLTSIRTSNLPQSNHISKYKGIHHTQQVTSSQQSPRNIPRYGQGYLQNRQRGVDLLLPLVAVKNRIGKTVSLFGLSSFREAGERLTDNSIQLRPNLIRSRPFQGNKFRTRRRLGHVVVKER